MEFNGIASLKRPQELPQLRQLPWKIVEVNVCQIRYLALFKEEAYLTS